MSVYSPKLKKDFTWNALGSLAQNAISPFLLVVVTRLNGISDSGLFSFSFSLAILFWAISMWGGRTFQVSDVAEEFSQKSYLIARIILGFATLVLALVFCWVNGYDLMKTSLICILVVFKIIESIADAIYGILQSFNKLYIVGISLILKAILGFLFFSVINLMTGDLIISSVSLIIVNLSIIFLYDVPQSSRTQKGLFEARMYHKKHANQALLIIKKCTPLFIISFLAMFSLNIPRYFIDHYHEGEIGYFGILVMPVTLLVLVVTFILQPKILILSRHHALNEMDEFSAILNRAIGGTIVIGMITLGVTYLVGTHILHLIFAEDFSNLRAELVVLVLGSIANAIVAIMINVLTIIRQFKFQLGVLLISNLLLLLASAMIISEKGLGAGIVLFTITNYAQAIVLLINYMIVKRRLDAQRN